MHHSGLFTLISLSGSIGIGLMACAPTSPPANPPSANASPANSPAASPTGSPSPNVPNSTLTPASSTVEKGGGAPASPAPGQAAAIATSTPKLDPSIPLTVEKLKNAEYYFLAKGPVKLVKGKYEDPATKRTYTMSDVVTYGDINKDGVKDAVTILKVTIPNQGDFSYLVALANEGGNPKNISSEFIGPQIVPKTLKVNPDSSIEAVMDQYQAGDPACCPSLKITRVYRLKLNPSPTPTATAKPK